MKRNVIRGLTLDEIDSLVASFQAAPDVGPNPRPFDEEHPLGVLEEHIFTLPDGSEWIPWDVDGKHVILLRRDTDPWHTEAIHVGLEDEPCPPTCAKILAEAREVGRLRRRVSAHGAIWKLGAAPTYGEPMYTSTLGWVARDPHVLEPPPGRPWRAGLNEPNYAEFEDYYATFREAMCKVAKAARRKKVCSHCGAPVGASGKWERGKAAA